MRLTTKHKWVAPKSFALFAGTLCLALSAWAESFVVKGTQLSGDSVLFKSTAKLEFIEGATNAISGVIQFNPDRTSDSIRGTLQVDLRTLRTGIDLRDEHMRTRRLETDQYPFAYFELLSASGLPDSLPAGVTCTSTVEGNFYIHGIKRKITPRVEIVDNSRGDSRELAVRVNFALNLDDWKIPRPKALFLKLAETIVVDVRFIARAGDTTTAKALPNWPDH